MIRRSLSTVAVSLLLAVAIAPASQARDLEPGEAQWVITPSDVKVAGAVNDESTNALGPTIPQACTSFSGQGTADGRESLETINGSFATKSGASWQSSVWTYKTAAAARRSYDQLKQRSIARCNDLFTGLIGDDEADMPAVQNQRSAVIPKSAAPRSRYQRFFAANTTMLLDPATARPGYQDTFQYATFALVGDAIVQVNLFQNTPVTPAQRTSSVRALNAISARYAASF